MTTATRERKAQKTVQIIARIQFKDDSRKVVYQVHGSHGEQYETCLFAGKATSCTCAARKPCYHMTQLEQRESERVETASALALVEEYIRQELDEDAQYQAWKREMGLDTDVPLTVEQVEQIALYELRGC